VKTKYRLTFNLRKNHQINYKNQNCCQVFHWSPPKKKKKLIVGERSTVKLREATRKKKLKQEI